MFQESTNPSIQEKVKKLVDVYGRAVLTHIVFHVSGLIKSYIFNSNFKTQSLLRKTIKIWVGGIVAFV
jgi:hypothetical protein